MVEQEAKVIKVEGDQLFLQAETQSSCNACEVKSGCGTSVLSKWVGRKFTHFQAKNTVNARAGDQVVVGLSESALVSGSLVIYFLPLLGMFIFALMADILLQASDLMVAVSAFVGFAVALLICRNALSKDRLKDQLSPVVLRKVLGRGRISP